MCGVLFIDFCFAAMLYIPPLASWFVFFRRLSDLQNLEIYARDYCHTGTKHCHFCLPQGKFTSQDIQTNDIVIVL